MNSGCSRLPIILHSRVPNRQITLEEKGCVNPNCRTVLLLKNAYQKTLEDKGCARTKCNVHLDTTGLYHSEFTLVAHFYPSEGLNLYSSRLLVDFVNGH